MLTRCVTVLVFLAAVLATASTGLAESFPTPFSYWPSDLKINGTVIACADAEVPSQAADIFLSKASGNEPKFALLALDQTPLPDNLQPAADSAASFTTLALFGDSACDATTARAAIDAADGVVLLSSRTPGVKVAESLTKNQEALDRLLDRGGRLLAVGPVLNQLGRYQTTDQETITAGLNTIPDAILFQEPASLDEIQAPLAQAPTAVGIGVPARTAIVLRGRKIRTYGTGQATFAIRGNDRQPPRVQRVGAASNGRANPYETIIDLTAWRRDAIERQLPAFPSASPPKPHVEKGTLIIVGGGGTPRGLLERMVELAGGKSAKMVYVPCREEETVPADDGLIRRWKATGVESAVVFHTKDRHQANSDEAFLEPLKEATGIWFGGGRQWNFADSYYGTKAHRLMQAVVERGGVIGGSSAGASIQGDYLARANPVANFDIMAAGYERGLGFLTGVAIDQHFSQRNRQPDMSSLVDRYPQLLGIGIDESTALIVNGSAAEIVGQGQVFFYDRRRPVGADLPDYLALGAGQTFDLAERVEVTVPDVATAE